MKLFATIILAFFLGKGCSEQQEMASARVDYQAGTRGFNYKISIHDQQVTVETGQRGQKAPVVTKLTDEQWNEFISEFAKLDLEKLSTYKAPTEKRFYDGALGASLQIEYKGKQYASESFDDGFPPAEIEKFVSKITAFRPSRE